MTRFTNVFSGNKLSVPPLWMMRQAGRYLPEYRKIRGQVSGFLELCYSPELACEVTLQPLRRFDLDAAIIFSDILVIPDALGQKVRFVEGEGPKLEAWPLENSIIYDRDRVKSHLAPVYEAISLCRSKLDRDISLIGFCGAPWTLATYMISGKGGNNFDDLRQVVYRNFDNFSKLINDLCSVLIDHLCHQIEAGADVVQIFDSWALGLDAPLVEKFSIQPIQKIIAGVRARCPHVKIIVFPKGMSGNFASFCYTDGADAIGLDWTQNIPDVRKQCSGITGRDDMIFQGNLDPMRLLVGGHALEEGVEKILQQIQGFNHIFNLGHGIDKSTPIAHVEEMIRLVKKG